MVIKYTEEMCIRDRASACLRRRRKCADPCPGKLLRRCTLNDFFGGTYATHMGIDLDERTGLPVYEGLVDFNGELTDPIELILSLPYIEDNGESMAIDDRLAWIADEYCFGINLYQNCTGIWENRATTAGLPYEDAIDEMCIRDSPSGTDGPHSGSLYFPRFPV